MNIVSNSSICVSKLNELSQKVQTSGNIDEAIQSILFFEYDTTNHILQTALYEVVRYSLMYNAESFTAGEISNLFRSIKLRNEIDHKDFYEAVDLLTSKYRSIYSFVTVYDLVRLFSKMSGKKFVSANCKVNKLRDFHCFSQLVINSSSLDDAVLTYLNLDDYENDEYKGLVQNMKTIVEFVFTKGKKFFNEFDANSEYLRNEMVDKFMNKNDYERAMSELINMYSGFSWSATNTCTMIMQLIQVSKDKFVTN